MADTAGTEFQVRGYMVVNAGKFLVDKSRELEGEAASRRAMERLSPETRAALEGAKPAGWYSVNAISELFGQIAGLASGDEDRAREMLIDAGAFNAKEATNTFLKLLMRMLSPPLFARKLPDFWRRDCTRGRLEVEVTGQRLLCRFYEMEGFDHVVAGTAGFASFALGAMGKTVEKITLEGWGLDRPWSEGASMELAWKE